MEIRTGGYNINDAVGVGESNKKAEKPGSPSVEEVNRFHDNDDVDGSAFAHHHTLGSRSTQAAAGNHRHDGTDSAALFSGLHDYYNKYETPSWMNGISIPQGLLVDVYDSSQRLAYVVSGTEKLIEVADDHHTVIAGHTYLLMSEFDARLNNGTGNYYMTVRFPAVRWERPPNPEGSPSVAPPPLLPPTASSTDYCKRGISYLEPKLGQYRTFSVVDTYTPQYNGIFYPGLSIDVTSGDLDIRRSSLRVIDLGRAGTGNHGTNYLLSQIVRELRKMGSDITILGAIDHDYHT